MVIEDTNFLDHKKQAIQNLQSALQQDEVDAIINSLLKKINNLQEYYTTSSCAGRILVLQLPEIGDKKHASFLGRWHRKVTEKEIRDSMLSFMEGQLWLLTQPPIFHIGCKTLSAADILMKIGINSGFKHSGIRSLSGQIIVELQSTERMDMPLGKEGEIIVPNSLLSFLIETANTALLRAQKKLIRLETEIEIL